MIIGLNNKIATKEFPSRDIKTEVTSGVGMIVQRNTLAKLEVVYGNGKEIDPGDFVFLAADSAQLQSWAKVVFDIEGQKVIVIPVDAVQLIEKKQWTDKVGVRGI
jgi:hypothetical protein